MNKNADVKNIILVGMMASGKTALGRSLALKLKMGFFDVDEWISRKARRSIAQIFLIEGEDRFRQWENDALIFMQSIRNHVVALGGGTIRSVADWPKVSHLGTSIWIHTSVNQIVENLLKHEHGLRARPLIADLGELPLAEKKRLLHERIPALLEQRLEIYRLADLEFVPTERSIRLNTMQLEDLLASGGISVPEGGAETGFAPLNDVTPVSRVIPGNAPADGHEFFHKNDSSES